MRSERPAVARALAQLDQHPAEALRMQERDPAAMRAYESKGQVIRVAAGQKVRVRVQPITSE